MEILRAAAFLIALGAAVGAVLSLGGAVSDRLDVFSHFVPIYLAAGTVALIARLVTRSDGAAVTLGPAGLAIVVSAALMAPDLIAATTRRPATATGETLKLIQLNLWEHNRDPAATAGWIEGQDADIVVLEEATGQGGRVAAALGALYPHRAAAAQPGRSSTLILSKAAMREGGELRATSGAQVSGAWASFGSGPSGFTVVGTHYTWPIPPGPQQAQSRGVTADLARFDRGSLIVAGDFNSTPWSFSLRRQDARFGLKRLTLALFTWPAAPFLRGLLYSPIPFLAIDHVYAGDSWQTVSVRRGPRLGSDHFPVVVVLRRAA